MLAGEWLRTDMAVCVAQENVFRHLRLFYLFNITNDITIKDTF